MESGSPTPSSSRRSTLKRHHPSHRPCLQPVPRPPQAAGQCRSLRCAVRCLCAAGPCFTMGSCTKGMLAPCLNLPCTTLMLLGAYRSLCCATCVHVRQGHAAACVALCYALLLCSRAMLQDALRQVASTKTLLTRCCAQHAQRSQHAPLAALCMRETIGVPVPDVQFLELLASHVTLLPLTNRRPLVSRQHQYCSAWCASSMLACTIW
jgi:hypothetical protein